MSGAYGRLVEIDHGSGITTKYGHLDRILVREGDVVKRGQLVGLQGNSGRSTGTHLHYEVRLNDQAINPANFLEAGKYVF
jgi:murein DD-endopeptidase MepM/ murein hydrolase activator NlpD